MIMDDAPARKPVKQARKTLATVLRSSRIAVGLTLREVESQVGFSNPYISQLENGVVTNPSFLAVVRLARLYELDLDDLAKLVEKESP